MSAEQTQQKAPAVPGSDPGARSAPAILVREMQDYYQPVGKLEEMLVEKIVVESARYARILGFEEQELSRANAFFNVAIDRVGRYTTSTNRALSRAIEDVGRLQAARKARESATAAIPDEEQPAAEAAAGESSA